MNNRQLGICCGLVIYVISLSRCIWSSTLSTQWGENFALSAYGTEATHPSLNDGNLESVAVIYPVAEGKRAFTLKFRTVKPVQKIIIHNENLFRFNVDYLNAETGEWETVHETHQHRNIGAACVQLKYIIDGLNFKTHMIRINVLRTVDDRVVSRHTVGPDNQIVSRSRVLRHYEEQFRVQNPSPASLREIEIYHWMGEEVAKSAIQRENRKAENSLSLLSHVFDEKQIAPEGVSTKKLHVSPGKEMHLKAPKSGNDFLLYVPKDYTPASSWPIIFCYPPKITQMTTWPFKQVTRNIGFIIIGMQHKDEGTSSEDQAFFDEVLAIVSSHLNVNKKMAFMGGYFQGGRTTSVLGEQLLNKLAGLIILEAGRTYGRSSPPPAEHIRGKPIFIGVGEIDELGDNSRAKEAAENYKQWGADVTFEEWPGVGHSVATSFLDHTTKLSTWLLTNSMLQYARSHTPLIKVRTQARTAEQAGQFGRAFALYQQVYQRAKNHQFGPEAAKATKRLNRRARSQLAEAEKALAQNQYAQATELLDQIVKVYEGSVFADRAIELKQTRLNPKADALEDRARAAEQVKDYAKALQLYALYLNYFSGADRYQAINARVKALKTNPEVQAVIQR